MFDAAMGARPRDGHGAGRAFTPGGIVHTRDLHVQGRHRREIPRRITWPANNHATRHGVEDDGVNNGSVC